MSVSFDLELGDAIKASARRRSQSVSAWIADAARDRLRNESLADAVSAWEAQFGELTESELAEAERILDRAADLRRKGVA
jgi:hypothetical protein